MVVTLFRFIQIVMAIGFFFLLMGTRSPKRRAHPDLWDRRLAEDWRRRRANFAVHERLARLKLRRVHPGLVKPAEPAPGERRAA